MIKFLAYTGEYPNLCRGELILEIDGIKTKFDSYYSNKENGKIDNEGVRHCNRCWSSGGSVWFDGDWHEHVEQGPWIINEDELPNDLKLYAEKIEELFNTNVPWGCCGGCV